MTYDKTIPLVNQTIQWGPLAAGWDSFTLLVDDVERYAGTGTNYSLAGLNASIPHFFRLAVSKLDRLVWSIANWDFGTTV